MEIYVVFVNQIIVFRLKLLVGEILIKISLKVQYRSNNTLCGRLYRNQDLRHMLA